MAIVFTRVDGRLIHGQVAVTWTRNVGAEKIIVIDDETAGDETQRMLVELAVPVGVTVEIYNVEDGATAIKEGAADEQKTMLITKKPDTILSLLNLGITIDPINIGGMYHESGKTKIEKALFVDDHDRDIFKQLQEKDATLFYQMAPMNKKQDLFSLLS
ncbi:PTS sugar transporter subunit IIB [Lederbergia sp. NSJ-179]|uniref:PTS system mannose/fructose/N-acetylgalactosamine-transporter subunit IIB n=1 Tax=Lederbergia sp. NSJ-179 TaxID=2931402 RepID=UPI001FD07EC3|nr:PTS sugar transporter subunit IIB [Lederbergia sp. NSJ-179]MCJ7843105.1 PTS sugar transporter subunit IIB [Lederbergia sp. NSJ-179]